MRRPSALRVSSDTSLRSVARFKITRVPVNPPLRTYSTLLTSTQRPPAGHAIVTYRQGSLGRQAATALLPVWPVGNNAS